jgi:ATP-dependent DNA helicase DinG
VYDAADMDSSSQILFPESPVLIVGLRGVVWLDSTGEIEELTHKEVVARLQNPEPSKAPPLLCHAPACARRLNIEQFPALDVLELFAFIRPTAFCAPTPEGLARAINGDTPVGAIETAMALRQSALTLLSELRSQVRARDDIPTAHAMAHGGWGWAPFVLAALGDFGESTAHSPVAGLQVWRRLGEWQDGPPKGEPLGVPVQPATARERLTAILGQDAEARPSQADYASSASLAFDVRKEEGAPNFVLAEAGTGVGKTLGYIAPASLWAETNESPVWISTFTRNLQHQIDQELDRLYPDERIKARHVVVRKGRENYLCLLNMDEAVRGVAVRRHDAIALGLMARWAARTKYGDMTGGDFPAWLSDILGAERTTGLADRRGECIYTGCTHYQKCFIERGVRRARHAHLVIANHALVMIHAARNLSDQSSRPTRYVFDEGHHLFDAADSAFSAHLTGVEAAELRRWIRGAEGRRPGRARGLQERVGDLVQNNEKGAETLEACLHAARTLPGAGWRQRCVDGQPQGATEVFLANVRQFVLARAAQPDSPYDLEAALIEVPDDLTKAAAALNEQLESLVVPLRELQHLLLQRLDDEAADLDTSTRNRIEVTANALAHRGEHLVEAWRSMLTGVLMDPAAAFADWFSVERYDGRDVDIGMHRHWIDPTMPFTEVVAEPAHGILITSATLTDGSGDAEADWAKAEARTGAKHLATPATRASLPSPFDYGAQTRVFVITDVRKNDMTQVAAAYRELFLAANGGALGLFTAINRLRAVHRQIASPLDSAGLALHAQHVDRLNLSSLIDIFRADKNSCLLGADAVRDGIDVPGDALRLIVFDRVPWPRPTILHKARRKEFGGRSYDDAIVRLRLKQAFGRLVRRASDRGVFVLLDSMMPSRLSGAFPDDVEIQRLGLADAVAGVSAFLNAPKDAEASP